MNRKYRRGDICFANLESPKDSNVIKYNRPVLIISNDRLNKSATIVNVIPITSQKKKPSPVHVALSGYGLERDSVAIVEQILTIDKCYLIRHIGSVDEVKMREIALAVEKQLSLPPSA